MVYLYHLLSIEVHKGLKSDFADSVARKEMPTNGLSMKIQANGKLFVVYKKGDIWWCNNNNNCTFTFTSSAEMVVHLTGSKHDACENAEEVKVADN
jgi:hypothetical protein